MNPAQFQSARPPLSTTPYHRKGTRVYKIIWEGYSAEEATWEPSENIHPEILADYEAGLEAEAQLDAEEAAAMEGDD